MAAIMQQLQAWVSASGILADKMAVIMIIALFGLMVVGLVLGQELAFVLGGAGVIIGWLAWGGPGVTIAMTKIYDQMQSYSMVAIPMFVLMANFLTHSKVADGLFESIRYLLGPLKGGLGLAVILVSTVFAATTGIVGASVVTMGMLSLPVLLRSGYKPSLACGMVCAGGSLGILIPPSIMLVSMGSYAEVSVGKIFFAAITPGLMLSLCYIIYLMVVCRIHPDWGPAMSAEELAEMPLKKRISGSLINLIPPLILIFAVLGSIFGGIATPTEAAGMGAIFALILAIFYKQFSWEMMKESLIDTAKTTAMVFIILFGAAAFTGVFMSLDGDQIIQRAHVNLGMAVALDAGLIVPVIRDADRMGLDALSAAAKDLASRAKGNKLTPDEYKGSTFSVSNLGMFGIETFTPIVNQPDAAILGVCAVEDELVMDDEGNISKHQVMRLSFTYDHRLIDGAVAAKFVMALRDLLEKPMSIIL